MRRPSAPPSLVGRLLATLVGSLTVVAIVLGIGGAWLINGIVESTADRLLGASAHAIAETLAVDDGQITLDLPPSALGMLENTERDNIYYSVRHDGDLLTGYPNLAPAPSADLPPEQSSFRYDTFRGLRIRVVAEARRLPRIPGVVVVEVAETLEARHDLARRMLADLAILEAAFIGVAALLVWPAVRWSLRPVTRLRQQMDARPADRADFAELPLNDVPVELAGLVIGFNALLTRLEASIDNMRRFTADASHQMRTPLAILRTHLAVLKKHPPQSEAGRNSVVDIGHATDRLQSLLAGLITLARANDTTELAADSAIDLTALARDVASDYAPAAAKGHVNLQFDAPEHVIMASADPFLAKEMLANLIDNAIRYNRRNGHVLVRILSTAHAPAIEIEDDGPGVPATDRERIFQRFYRLPRDQKQIGSGLGLSIVRAIANRIGATVTIEAAQSDRGLLVRVYFEAVPDLVRPSQSSGSAAGH